MENDMTWTVIYNDKTLKQVQTMINDYGEAFKIAGQSSKKGVFAIIKGNHTSIVKFFE
jgi:hypothetical protein